MPAKRLTPVDFDPFDGEPTQHPDGCRFRSVRRRAGEHPISRSSSMGRHGRRQQPEHRTISGQLREAVVGIPAGAVQSTGTALRGAAALQDSWGPRYQELLRSIESADIPEDVTTDDLEARFEAPKPSPLDKFTGGVMRRAEPSNPLAALDEEMRFADMPGEMRTKLRTALRGRIEGRPEPLDEARSAIPTPVRERGLYQAGEAVSEFAEETFPARPGYEDSLGRAVGEGLGSLATGVAAGLIPGVGTLAATALFTTMGAGEAADNAVRAGASDEEITREAAAFGLAAGGTDVLPVETAIWDGLPVPGATRHCRGYEATGRCTCRKIDWTNWRSRTRSKPRRKAGSRRYRTSFPERSTRPTQVIMEGVETGAGVGGIVGGIAALTKEGVLGIATRRSRSARGNRARAVENVPPLTPEDQASPIANADLKEGRERLADAQATQAVNEYMDVVGLPKVGQPVRVARGRDVVEGVVTDGWEGDGPGDSGVSVTAPDGTVLDITTGELDAIGGRITGLPMPAAEADIAKKRAELEKEAANQIREADKQAEKVARSADGSLVVDALSSTRSAADEARLGEALVGMSGTSEGTKALKALAGMQRSAPGDMVMRALAGQGPQMNPLHLGMALNRMQGATDGDAMLEAIAGKRDPQETRTPAWTQNRRHGSEATDPVGSRRLMRLSVGVWGRPGIASDRKRR